MTHTTLRLTVSGELARGYAAVLRVSLAAGTARADEPDVTMTWGMAVTAEITTGQRRRSGDFPQAIAQNHHRKPARATAPYFTPEGAAGDCAARKASRSRRSTASRSRMRSMDATFSSQVRLAACLRQAALARAALVESAEIGTGPAIGSGVASFMDSPLTFLPQA